jgi:hypothetical protein
VNINTLERESAEPVEMNDIAAVEFETSSPLFFDAYRENRITGSFIVIDPLTNATLGAGMIQEDLSNRGAVETVREMSSAGVAITPLARYQRHGHYPAIFFVNTRTTLAGQLERALFEAGFEVTIVESRASFLSVRTACTALLAAGFVVIYQNPAPAMEERVELRAAADDHFFDLAELDLPSEDAEAVARVLVLAEALRIPQGTGNDGKVV